MRVRIEVHAEQTPLGCWVAIDNNRYDGASDAGPQHVGYGKTDLEAVADLLRNMADAAEEDRL